MDTTIQDTGTQIIQFLPEQYQAPAMTVLGILGSIIGFYYLTKPFFDNWRANKQNSIIAENSLTAENVQEAVDKGMQEYKLLMAKKDLANWQYKLAHATTDEAKQMCNAEIAKLEAEIQMYA